MCTGSSIVILRLIFRKYLKATRIIHLVIKSDMLIYLVIYLLIKFYSFCSFIGVLSAASSEDLILVLDSHKSIQNCECERDFCNKCIFSRKDVILIIKCFTLTIRVSLQ